jgi:hypothetical protein
MSPPADGVDGAGAPLGVPPLAVLARPALSLPTLLFDVFTLDATALDVRPFDAMTLPDGNGDRAVDLPATVPAFEPQPLASTTLSATVPRTTRRPIPKLAIPTT